MNEITVELCYLELRFPPPPTKPLPISNCTQFPLEIVVQKFYDYRSHTLVISNNFEIACSVLQDSMLFYFCIFNPQKQGPCFKFYY